MAILSHIKGLMTVAQGTTAGSGRLNTSGVTSQSTRAQTAVIYDLLSEGPIEGLKDENPVASIRLNDNPVANSANARKISPQRSFDCNYVASTGVVTDNTTQNIFSGASTADGRREVQIFGGKKRTSSSINATAGNNIIISTNSGNMSFADNDVYDGSTTLEPMIRIDGAGINGEQLIAGITERINSTAIRVDYTPQTTVTNTAAYIDLVAEIGSFSGNTCTLSTSGQGVNVSNNAVIMSSPTTTPFDRPSYNYQNFGYAFRTGTREQAYLPTPRGIGSASVAHNVSGGNLPTTQGTGYPSPSAFGFKEPTENYTGTALTITSAQMGVGNPGEIDVIKATLAFNAMISQKETGKLGIGFAEYRITFGYSRDGGSTYTDVVKVGRATISTSTSSYHKNGRAISSQSGIITNKTKQPFNHVFTMNVEQYQPFDAYRLKFERISVVNQKEGKWQQQNAGVVKQIENIITDKLTYPYSAYGAVIVDAEDFDQIPKRTYVIRGLKVKVPTNYFPRDERDATTGIRRSSADYTRNVTSGAEESSVQDWDGNFRGDKNEFDATSPNYEPVYCNNPVWVFYDLLTNQRYGLGKYLDEDFDFSLIDKYTMFQLAKYCDELVPDGKGGTEPRFTCNLYIQKDMDAIKMLKNMASMIRSMLIWYNGKITLGSNQQKGAVYTFSKSNVVGGQFAYNGSANRFRHNQVAVTWSNPENGYRQEVEVVEDHDEIARTGKIRRKNITGYGVTSRGQAIRHGKYQLYSEKLEKEIVNFSTGLNAFGLKPGDVINVQDPDINDIVASGRVTTSSASSTTVIKTDRDLTSYLNTDDSFKLHLIYPSGGAYLTQPRATINSTDYVQGDLILLDEDGNSIDTHAKASNLKDDSGAVVQTFWSDDLRVETQSVSSFNASSVTVSSAFSSTPDSEVMFTITGQTDDGVDVTGSTKQYIITNINPGDDMNFTISAAEYDISKFDAVDRGWEIPVDPFIGAAPQRTADVGAPTGLTVQIVPGSANGGDDTGEGDTITDYSIVVNWSHPKTDRLDSDGNALDDVDEDLAGYNIQHNMELANSNIDANRVFDTVRINSNNRNSYTFNNVVPGTDYIIRIQAVDTQGRTSGFIQQAFSFDEALFPAFGQGTVNFGLNGAIMKGGVLTCVPNVDSSNGTVTFSSGDYVFTPPTDVEPLVVAAGTGDKIIQTFAIADGEEAFLLYDYSDTSDPLKAIEFVTDTTAIDADTSSKYNFDFMSQVGASNNDLTAATGTISSTAGDPTITGSSTAFTTDFSVGHIVALDSAGTTRFMAKIINIESDTEMTLDASPTRSYSGVSIHKQNLPIDHKKDAIIARVSRSGSTYSLVPFTNKFKVENSDEIGGNTITSVQISANSVGSAQIAANSIDSAALTADAVASFTVSANSITSLELAANSVNSAIIEADAIGSAEIAANAIGTSEISANSIGTAAIIAGSIGSSEVAANAINAVNISAGAIGQSEISANSIGTAQIIADSITSSEVAANAIGSVQVSANSISSNQIAANSIDAVAIAANSIAAAALTTAALDSFTVSANEITSVQLASNSVNAVAISANAVASAEIQSNSVDTAQIAANSINSVTIESNAIGTAQIAANSVNGSIIVKNSVGTTEIALNSVNGIIIAQNAVTGTQVASNAINTAQVITGAIEALQIAANAVQNSAIQNNAVQNESIQGNAVANSQIAANAVNNASILANAVRNASIQANAVRNAQIQNNAVQNAQIQNNAVQNESIQGNAVQNSQIAGNAVTTASLIANAVTSAILAQNSVTNNIIQANAVQTAQIQSNAIAAAQIQGNAIGSAEIAGNAIGAAEIAANSVQTAEIKSNNIVNASIAGNAVQTAQIKSDAVTNASIAGNAVQTAQIKSDNITNGLIAANAVQTAQIKSNNITSASIVSDAIDSSHLAANSVGSAAIVADSITSNEIAANSIDSAAIVADAITSNEIAANSIGTAAIQAGAIGSSEIAANSIGSTAIVAGSIGSSEIAANSIGSTAIVAGSIGSSEISANSINSAAIQAGAITQNEISANSINAAAIIAGTITNSEIAANSINSVSISANAVTTNQVAANAITNLTIATGAVDTNEIAADAITNAKIEAGAVNNASIASNADIGFAKISVGNGDISSAMIAADAITAAKIAANSVDSAEIVAGSIDSVHIGANQITTAKISSSASIGFAQITGVSIGEAQIAANAITSTKIKAGAIDTAEIAANAIENAQISSSDSLTLTVTGGSAGGWTLNSSALSTTGVVIDSTNRRILISD